MIPAAEMFNRYNTLIKDLEEIHLAGLSQEEIKSLVTCFTADINSKRVASHIKDFRLLVSILETRNVLKPENVQRLEIAARLLGRNSALNRIEEYKTWMSPPPPPAPVVTAAQRPLTSLVFEAVSDKIGRNWRDFVRCLKHLNECEISQIDRKHSKDDKSATLEALEEFVKKQPEEDHVKKVVHALEEIKRYAIVRDIESIIQTYNNKK